MIVEVHPRPEVAWSDGDQSLTLGMFTEMMENLTGPMRAIFSPQEQFAVA